jgi:hypothetical protein
MQDGEWTMLKFLRYLDTGDTLCDSKIPSTERTIVTATFAFDDELRNGHMPDHFWMIGLELGESMAYKARRPNHFAIVVGALSVIGLAWLVVTWRRHEKTQLRTLADSEA